MKHTKETNSVRRIFFQIILGRHKNLALIMSCTENRGFLAELSSHQRDVNLRQHQPCTNTLSGMYDVNNLQNRGREVKHPTDKR